MDYLIKKITQNKAEVFLKKLDMQIGKWKEIKNNSKDEYIHYHVPRDADKMYTFATYAASYLPNGKWKLFQMDYSSSLSKDEAVFLSTLVNGKPGDVIDFNEQRSFLIEFNNNSDENNILKEILISQIIYLCLLFECHSYIVSEGSRDGEIVGVQDGFVYFIFKNKKVKKSIKDMLAQFERTPNQYCQKFQKYLEYNSMDA